VKGATTDFKAPSTSLLKICLDVAVLRDSWICFDRTKTGLAELFSARESLVIDIPAGDRNAAKPFYSVPAWFWMVKSLRKLHDEHITFLHSAVSLAASCSMMLLPWQHRS